MDAPSHHQSKACTRRRSLSLGDLPTVFHVDCHPMAFYNDSFVANETPECHRFPRIQSNDEKAYRKDIHPAVEDDVTEECNDVHRWNLDKIFSNYKLLRSKNETRVDTDNFIFGAENVIELPKKYSKMDKIVLSKTRNIRRNAVHIYDSEKLTEILKLFLTFKHSMNYEIMGNS